MQMLPDDLRLWVAVGSHRFPEADDMLQLAVEANKPIYDLSFGADNQARDLDKTV